MKLSKILEILINEKKSATVRTQVDCFKDTAAPLKPGNASVPPRRDAFETIAADRSPSGAAALKFLNSALFADPRLFQRAAAEVQPLRREKYSPGGAGEGGRAAGI